jgi:hypothetical protein
VKNAAQGVANAVGNVFSGLGGHIHDGLAGVAGVIGRFDNMVDNLPVIGGILNLPKSVPGFAQGGIVDRPTLGVFGEAGPEALIPLGGGQRGAGLDLWRQAGEKLGAFGGQPHGLGANTTPGTWGGQCLVFVENVLGRHWPYMFASQMCDLVNSQSPAPGEVFVSSLPPYGHVGFVIGGGKVLDSNWGLDEQIRIHSLRDVPDICGYISGMPASGLPGGTLDVTGALKGLVGRAMGGLGGWEGNMATALLGNMITGLGKQFDSGGILPPGLTLAYNGTGRPEQVLAPNQSSQAPVINITVTQSNASPAEIGRELAWALKTAR